MLENFSVGGKTMEQKRNLKQRKSQGGFTLIELLVVMIILGILSGIMVMKIGGSDEGAVIASMQTDARNAITAENLYYTIARQYVDATVSDGGTVNLGTSNVKISASPSNTVTVVANNGGCVDGSDGFTVTVTSTKTAKTVTYDSCVDASPIVN